MNRGSEVGNEGREGEGGGVKCVGMDTMRQGVNK